MPRIAALLGSQVNVSHERLTNRLLGSINSLKQIDGDS